MVVWRVFIAAAILALALVGAGLLGRWSSEGERSAYFEERRAYAARVLEAVGVVPDVLAESSGLAVSRTQSGVLWSHNDSGDGPTLYAIDQSGRLLAVVPVDGAEANDWEDLGAGPCPAVSALGTSDTRRSSTCLYVADTGDNQRVRDVLTIYVLAEPQLDEVAGARLHATALALRFRYPDEPHDSEALAVLPDGSLTIVTKGRTGRIEFFELASRLIEEALGSDTILTAEHRGDAGIAPDIRFGRQVTGAALSPDGWRMAVRTYTEIYFFGRAGNGTPGGGWRDLDRPCLLGDVEPVGEAIDWLDDDTLLLASEQAPGRPGSIHRVQC